MRMKSTSIALGILVAISLQSVGCDKGNGKLGMTGTAGSEAADKRDREVSGEVGVQGTGNAATSNGGGATNGVSGTETPGGDRVIYGIGNTPSGRGITTQPATSPAQ